MLETLEENDLLCPHQSRFRSSDSFQSQLLSIVYDIYASFDQSSTLEMRSNVLDICKAFDKVWHGGLLFQIECIGMSRNLLSIIKDLLNNRFQRVALACRSTWFHKLGPLIFFIYINDLPHRLGSTIKFFADDIHCFNFL